MDQVNVKINAVTAAVLTLLNALGGVIGMPAWATPEAVGLANSAAISVAALVIYIVSRSAAPAPAGDDA